MIPLRAVGLPGYVGTPVKLISRAQRKLPHLLESLSSELRSYPCGSEARLRRGLAIPVSPVTLSS